MTCTHCNDTGYRPSTRIICGCLDREERDNLVTVTLTRQDAKTLMDFAESCSFDVDIGLPGKIRKALEYPDCDKITTKAQNQG